MLRGDPVWRGAALVCGLGGLAALVAFWVAGDPLGGVAAGLGLGLGAGNGLLARRMLAADLGRPLGSLGRLAALSAVAVAVAWPLGLRHIPILIGGMAVAQLVLAVVAALVAVESARS